MSKVVLITPDGNIREENIELTLKTLQSMVEGPVEVVPGFYAPRLSAQDIFLLISEHGRLDKKDPTVAVIGSSAGMLDILHGNVVCVGADREKQTFTGLSETQVETIREYIGALGLGIPFVSVASC